MFDSLGDRMKRYEDVTEARLIRRMPAIIRLDGRAFHTFTKNFKRPFDEEFNRVMEGVAEALLAEVQTSVFAYTQSDEISILLKDYTGLETQPWFDGRIQKICSIAAAIATAEINLAPWVCTLNTEVIPMFDARVFNIPKEDVVNYFIWRQQDAIRNSINMLAQHHFSHKQLQGVSQKDALGMLEKIGVKWEDCSTVQKRGLAVYRTSDEGRGDIFEDNEIPIFSEDREFISRFVETVV